MKIHYMKISCSLFLILFLLACDPSKEPGLTVDLTGSWRIQFRDDIRFAGPEYDDSDWDLIGVPAAWEEEGFPGYDGYVWYRKDFRLSKKMMGKVFILDMGLIHDVDAVYINGHYVNGTGEFPPGLIQVLNKRRLYRLNSNHLNFNSDNIIAVRVYNDEDLGGIVSGRIGVYSEMKDTSRYSIPVEIDLSGQWKFRAGDDSAWAGIQYDDDHWDEIDVPARWEHQGHMGYDGYAWYRQSFIMPDRLSREILILALGRINDVDEVYFNGEKIGRTGVFPGERINRDDYAYWARNRFYLIHSDLILWNRQNTIAVRVYDYGNGGGIVEGPIGIVKREGYLKYPQNISSELSNEEDERQEIDLTGQWRFEIGDSSAYSYVSFDDSIWSLIDVPAYWENAGYPGYDGFAWYRYHFLLPEKLEDDYLILKLGRIDDAEEVYLNGHHFNGYGTLAPNASSAAGVQREFVLPHSMLLFGRKNQIAVRVFDQRGSGGIYDHPVGIYSKPEISKLLKMDLSGFWKFALGDNAHWSRIDYHDSHWNDMPVPANWEQIGFPDMDGFAWYRTRVLLDQDLARERLILCLGKINDFDEVYFNGVRIGQTGSFTPVEMRPHGTLVLYFERYYFIPSHLIHWDRENVIAVRVYDIYRTGGIWDGPVGITTREAYLEYMEGRRKGK